MNGILVAQAGVGTDQIGRFDVVVDDDTNSIVDYTWQLVPITSEIAQPDDGLSKYIDSFKQVVDRKYQTVLCKLAEELTHPTRIEETALGNLVADALAERAAADVILVGSGSIRSRALGPLVTLGDFVSCFPFEETLARFTVTGAELRRIFGHIMRPENRTGEGECYQTNAGVRAVYDREKRELRSLCVAGLPVEDDRTYTLALPGYHVRNAAAFLNVTPDELARLEPPRLVSTSVRDVLEEFFRNHQNARSQVEGRLIYG